jgi:hypothetical protein
MEAVRIIGVSLQVHTALQPRRPTSTSSPSREPKSPTFNSVQSFFFVILRVTFLEGLSEGSFSFVIRQILMKHDTRHFIDSVTATPICSVVIKTIPQIP